MGRDAAAVKQAETRENKGSRANRSEPRCLRRKARKPCAQACVRDGAQQMVALRAHHQKRIYPLGRKRAAMERVDGDAAAACHQSAFCGDDVHGVERRFPTLRQDMIGAVEDGGRPRHVEQFETRIDDKGNAMHWQKIP